MSISLDDVALSFKYIGISSLVPPEPIISNVSGYVVRGGITAVLGPSASGKSLLMKALAGRLSKFQMNGSVALYGMPMDPSDINNSITYVPQDEFLMGEFTPRETLTSAMLMKTNSPSNVIETDVSALLQSFGLEKVADNLIGTVFYRGLSGGQRKRVEVCSELIAPQAVLMLDEPTSGLDGSIAFEVLTVLKKILAEKNGNLSIIISIHQPNSRILELFDHILILGQGGMLFFGTVPESVEYFTGIGFPPPEGITPTDVYLQVTDSNFGSNQGRLDFLGAYACSDFATKLNMFLDLVNVEGASQAMSYDPSEIKNSAKGTESAYAKVKPMIDGSEIDSKGSFMRQYWTLINRDFALAYRDPSLYYLQFVLVSAFGFLVGAAFFKLEATIDSRISNISAGLLWIVMMMCYIQVFKVYHLNQANIRFTHEVTNNTYSIFAGWLAELTSTAVLLASFIPGTAVAYFMMDLPGNAYPFLIFLFWLTALTAESMLNFLSKFSEDATVSIVASQCVLVILTVFGGGIFIPWDDMPHYWFWLQECSLFTQASRAAMINVYDHVDYSCALDANNECTGPLSTKFPCDASSPSNNYCVVSGRMVLNVLQGTNIDESKWIPFGYLVLIFVVFRLLVLLLMYYPVDKFKYWFQEWRVGISSHAIIQNEITLKLIGGQLNAYIALHGSELSKTSSACFDKENTTSSNKISTSLIENCGEELFEKHFDSMKTLPSPDSSSSSQQGSCLEWKGLSVNLKKGGNTLIDNVSGVALPGRILALMGHSGAGKTTLLNALSNRTPYANLTGKVYFGKRNFAPSDLIYVPQFDEFNQNLSVKEQIELVGYLKCKDMRAVKRRLGNVISILGLGTRTHTLCKDLTSGELKRVSVGMGMICNPNVLFLDEPTTGLDSTAAYSIVKYLSQLSAATNVVVVMTIHQPSEIVFNLLQDLYLLETGGKLAYFGPLKLTKQYFRNISFTCPQDVSPSDFYLDLVNKPPTIEEFQSWSDIYYSSVFHSNFSNLLKSTIDSSAVSETNLDIPSSFSRFLLLVEFFYKYYCRDIGFYYLRLCFLVIVALFIGTIFLRLQTNTSDIPKYSGAIFFNIWTTLFSAVAATGLLAADRRQAIEQVKNAVITPFVYCLAQFMVSVPFDLILSVIYQAIFHNLVNINPDGESFVYAVMITMGHLLLMESIMLTVVAVLKNAMLSVTFAMVVLGYLFLFSGFFILVEDMPAWIGWISYITPTMYSFEGYIWQVYSTQDFSVSGYSGMVLSGLDVLKYQFDKVDVNSWGMFGVLLAWIALFRIAHFLAFSMDVRPYMTSSSSSSSSSSNSNKNSKEEGEIEFSEMA